MIQMPRPKKNISITSKDIEIFTRIYEQRTMTIKQVAIQFYPSTTIQNVHKRLAKLEKYGYIRFEKLRFNAKWISHLYLTSLSFKWIKNSLKYEVVRPSFYSSSVIHDLTLVDLRARLDSLDMIKESLCENMLQSSNCDDDIDNGSNFQILNTDLAIHFDSGFGRYWLPVEWEASEKGKSRIMNKLMSYYAISEIPAVLYICEDKSIQSTLQRCDEEICKNFNAKLFTCLKEDVLNFKEHLQLRSSNKKVLILK